MKKVLLSALCLFTLSLMINTKGDQISLGNSAKAFGPCCDTEEHSICGLDGVNYPDQYLSKEMEISF